MNVSLPRSQKDWVREEAKRSGCSTPSEYVRRLIRDAQLRADRERLETLLLEGLSSGDDIEMTPEDWDDLRRELVRRVEARRKQA